MDNFSKENYTNLNYYSNASDDIKKKISELWCLPVELIGALEFGEPILHVSKEVDELEPVYEITVVVPIKCNGYPPGKCEPTYFKQAVTLVVGLFSGMWKVGESCAIPIMRVDKGDNIRYLENTISDLQKTIDLLLKERQSICPYPFKYSSEMPEWFKNKLVE
jgi:hypothetical protein